MAVRPTVVAFAVASASAVACAAVLGIDDLPRPSSGDGGANEDAAGDPDSAPATLMIGGDPKVTVARKGSAALNVVVMRPIGFGDPVHVTLEGLPPALAYDEVDIPAGATTATLTLRASEAAKQGSATVVVRGRGGQASAAHDVALTIIGAPGDRDESFGDGGVAEVTMGDDDWVEAIAVQPDGKIVVAGYTASGGEFDVAVARFLSNGALDPGFGAGGTMKFDPGYNASDSLEDIAFQPDGKLLFAGATYRASNQDFMVVRLRADGSRDLSFGSVGVVFVAASPVGRDNASTIALAPDSASMLVGGVADGRLGWAMLDTDSGAAIPAFGDGGRLQSTIDASVAHGTPLADGTLVLAGPDAVVHVLRDGGIDPSFGDSGIVSIPFGPTDPPIVARQPDGRFVVLASQGPLTSNHVVGMRVSAAGAPDPSFGDGGRLDQALSTGYLRGFGVVAQPDGKVVFAATSQQSPYLGVLARFDANGNLESAFGDGGAVIERILTDAGTNDIQGKAVALTPSGRIVLGAMRVDGVQARFRVYQYWP